MFDIYFILFFLFLQISIQTHTKLSIFNLLLASPPIDLNALVHGFSPMNTFIYLSVFWSLVRFILDPDPY